MTRRNDNIHRKIARKMANARTHEHHFAREQSQPTRSSCLLSWLNAISPTGRTRILGVVLAEREPLPEGVFEKYAWQYGRLTETSVLDQMSFAGTTTARLGFAAPGDVVVDAGADGETGPPATVVAAG